jgi:hypothetical protein
MTQLPTLAGHIAQSYYSATAEIRRPTDRQIRRIVHEVCPTMTPQDALVLAKILGFSQSDTDIAMSKAETGLS